MEQVETNESSVQVSTKNLRAIAKSSSDKAKTNALLNAAREIDRLRAALDRVGGGK